jgi:hypothetical protein
MVRMAAREFAESEIKPGPGELDEKEEFSDGIDSKNGVSSVRNGCFSEEYGGQGWTIFPISLPLRRLPGGRFPKQPPWPPAIRWA